METVKAEISSAEPASRVELFVRIIWAIPLMIVIMILTLVAEILLALQWLYILILGKRQLAMQKYINLALVYQFKATAYLFLGTEERAPIMPEGM